MPKIGGRRGLPFEALISISYQPGSIVFEGGKRVPGECFSPPEARFAAATTGDRVLDRLRKALGIFGLLADFSLATGLRLGPQGAARVLTFAPRNSS
jgi:hypothetical protein